jgi:transposase
MAERIDISLDELRQLRGRIDDRQLEPDDWPIVGALVSKLIARTEARQKRMLDTIARQEAHASHYATSGGGTVGDDESSGDAALAEARSSAFVGESSKAAPTSPASGVGAWEQQPEEKKKPTGHGRHGVDAFVNAEHFHHQLSPGIIGTVCEDCGPVRGAGRMSHYREKVIIRIVGQPLLGAQVHHYQQARCRICGKIIRAAGPPEVLEGIGSSYITYDWSACAMLMVMHYFAGAPFKRLESLHNGWGVPMPDANQWSMVDACSDLLCPLHKAIEHHGIQNALTLRIDDTGSMVISLRRQIQAEIAALEGIGESTKDVRTGINATGVYFETHDDAVIMLFYTGRHHAGEIIDQLIKHRQSSKPKIAKVTDGASKNFVHDQEDRLIEATCNVHAFLKFRAIKDKYPAEYATAGEVYKQVFDNDDEAKARGLTPTERMHYHRKHSKPLMEKLKAMCKEKITSKLVEPSSLLWEPLTFIINQWERLTKFYQEPNIPLDTNLVEQGLIIPVRYLAGSFNYKNQNGADVGDLCMSLVATARANDVEPVAYLTDCLRNHQDLAKRPEYYLPWVYRERIRERALPPEPEALGDAPHAPQETRPRSLCDLAPELREGAAHGVTAPYQNLQLAGEKRRAGRGPIPLRPG